jgi:ribokinase
VDVKHVLRDGEAPTGVAVIALDDAGQNSIILAPGANKRWAEGDIEAAEETLASAAVLLLQLEIPLAVVERAVGMARSHGVTTILNPAPARPLPPTLLSQIDYLVPNESEAALLTGVDITDIDSAMHAAEKIRDQGVKVVLVTLGGRGCVLVGDSQRLHVPAFPVEVVDTTAAGDAFVGGLAVALAEGRSLLEAVRFSSGAGALATTRLGAQPSLPHRPELENFLRER